jgi:hypothetical protein
LALLALSSPAAGSEDPTLEELLEGHVAARGGRERLQVVLSLRLTGTHANNSIYSPLRVLRKRPSFYRLDAQPDGRPLTDACDGEQVWRIDPRDGASRALVIEGDLAEVVLTDADFDGPLIDYRAKGHEVELLGVEERDSGKAYALRVTLKRGAVERWYLDRDSLLAVERVSTIWFPGMSFDLHTYNSDFKEVEGLVLPHLIETEYSSVHRMLIIETVELNPELPDALFKRPEGISRGDRSQP